MGEMKYLSRKKNIMGGALCIEGTRIPIAIILYRLSEGKNIKYIRDCLYPSLTGAKISLAIRELADVIKEEKSG